MRLVVLSDIHGNRLALKQALAQTRSLAPDRLVILGDLFTYGPDVVSVLDQLEEAAVAVDTTWIWGNHEEIYDDLQDGRTTYLDTVSDWVRSSVLHTAAQVPIQRLRGLDWKRELTMEGLLFAHANPFGDWRYINSVGDHVECVDELTRRGLRAGIFGHTHRSRLYEHPAGTGATDEHPVRASLPRAQAGAIVANAGSVGQPRNRTARSTILSVDVTDEGLQFEVHDVDYDVHQHVDELLAMPLPDATKQRLARFFHLGADNP